MQPNTFLGEVRDPYFSWKITKGFVEFTVRYVQGGSLRPNAAQLVSASGEVYPVTVQATSIPHPVQDPREFHVRVDGISFEKAKSCLLRGLHLNKSKIFSRLFKSRKNQGSQKGK